MASMPKTTPEGYKLLIYRLVDTDPSKVIFGDCMKTFCMFNDVCLSEDILADGYIVVFDMKGVRLGHLTRIQLGPLRAFMNYIQEAHPARLKKIHIVHTSAIINQIMLLVKPLIKSEMLSLLQFSSAGPEEFFSKDILPKVCITHAEIMSLRFHFDFLFSFYFKRNMTGNWNRYKLIMRCKRNVSKQCIATG